MNKYLESKHQEKRRRKREWIIIICLVLLLIPFYYAGINFFDLGLDLSIPDSTLIFILINVNVIILLGLLYLTVRNLVKLLFERKKRIMGARLRTKLVLAFMMLSGLTALTICIVNTNQTIEYLERQSVLGN